MFIKQGKTNLKYILIVVILAAIIGGGILSYQWWIEKEEMKTSELELSQKTAEKEKGVRPEEVTLEEKELEESRIIDLINNVEIIARENKLNKEKTDIFIKDLKTNKEEFFITLSNVRRSWFHISAEFRNGHLYIIKKYVNYVELWKYSSPEDKGNALFRTTYCPTFRVSPDEAFLVYIADPVSLHNQYPSDTLIFINLITGEQKKISEVATERMISFLKEVSPRHGLNYVAGLSLLQWSSDSKNLWAEVDLTYRGSTPAELSDIGFLKINVKDWEIKKFEFPSCAVKTDLNMEREVVLYDCIEKDPPICGEHDCINGDLSVRLFNLRSGKEEVIISYPLEIWGRYFKTSFYYSYPGTSEYALLPRHLDPKWIDNDIISYRDIETREEVIKRIE